MAKRVVASKGLPERRARRRSAPTELSGERARSILDAAAGTFGELGYQAATLGDVAERAGLNRASIYYYFATKEDLLLELISAPLLANTARMEEIVSSDLPVTEKIDRAIRDLMSTFDDHYPALNIYFEERFERILERADTPQHAAMFATQSRYMELWTLLMTEGRRDGELTFPGDPRIASFAIAGMIVFTSRWYRADGLLSATQIGELFRDFILNGFLPRSPLRRSVKASSDGAKLPTPAEAHGADLRPP